MDDGWLLNTSSSPLLPLPLLRPSPIQGQQKQKRESKIEIERERVKCDMYVWMYGFWYDYCYNCDYAGDARRMDIWEWIWEKNMIEEKYNRRRQATSETDTLWYSLQSINLMIKSAFLSVCLPLWHWHWHWPLGPVQSCPVLLLTSPRQPLLATATHYTNRMVRWSSQKL